MKNIQKLTLSLLLATLSVSLFSAADDRFGKKSFDENFLSHIKKHSIGLFLAHELIKEESLRRSIEENTQQLFCSVRKDNILEANRLIELGADINQLDSSGYPPIWNCSTKMAQLLIEKKANLNICIKERIYTRIIDAPFLGPRKSVMINKGGTPLIWHIQKNDLEKAEMLIKGGANINGTDEYSRTALMHAASCRKAEPIVKLLLLAKADGMAADAIAINCGNNRIASIIQRHYLPQELSGLFNEENLLTMLAQYYCVTLYD